jgi:hypothetical protein
MIILICYIGMLYHILYLFDNVLFTDLTWRYMPLLYLMPLDDFDTIPIYSWGLIMLACLYINLCLACIKKATQVWECLLLLQV